MSRFILTSGLAVAVLFGGAAWLLPAAHAQARITYNHQQIFLSGANVAWVNWASDIGPGATNFNAFREMFDSLHACGGNSMRLWLHTTGAATPQFNSSGIVTGPGVGAIADLDSILAMAWRRKVGLMLCLWSFDMLRTVNGPGLTDRARLMLTDPDALQAYIDNALVPMVTALKGHPGILAWEVFNEAEGMSNEFGWEFTLHVPMSDIQRFVNRVAGAIHRTDSTAQVTTGAWSFMALSDRNFPAKGGDPESVLASMTAVETRTMEEEFASRYQTRLSAERILSHFMVPANMNYYRDDRLVAAGGDPDGTLDFYTVHFYTWAGTSLSPFHHTCEDWGLTKPLVVAEFYLEQSLGVLYPGMYRNLMAGGYAGALTWQWYQNNTQQPRTKEVMRDLFYEFPSDLDVAPVSGTVYSFNAMPPAIEAGGSSTLSWKAAIGSTVTLDGGPVLLGGTRIVSPETTTTYTLIAGGTEPETVAVSVAVYPTGRILSFTASPAVVGPGEKSVLSWMTAVGSAVTLDGVPVGEDDSIEVRPDSTRRYVLAAHGQVHDTSAISVNVRPADRINRALSRPVSVSTNSDDTQVGVPGHLVDGNYATQWGSLPHEAQWAIIDLGQSFRVTRVVVSWGSKYAKIYRLGISPDNRSWSLLAADDAGNGGTDELDSLAGVGRYVKLLMDKSVGGQGYTIREIELFGVPEGGLEVGEAEGQPPRAFVLEQNYPNPFNGSTVIRSSVPSQAATGRESRSRQTAGPDQMSEARHVKLAVFDLLGREVAVLVDEWRTPGAYHDVFSATGGGGRELASGVYIYRLTAGSFVRSKTMLLLR